jgi:agmatine deiminase
MIKQYHSRPAEDGFHMPAEFEPHEGTILIWPVRSGSWQFGGRYVKETFLQIAVEIAKGERVFLCAGHSNMEEMKTAAASFWEANQTEKEIRKNISFLEISSDDSWARDIGPTILVDQNGERRGINWAFNAWGGTYNGLYQNWEQDNAFALKFLEKQKMDVYDASDFVMEGGAIHVDGEGTAVVTKTCLLSPGRNPHLTKEEIEKRLKEMLQVTKVIWLPCGIFQDETDEHVDNMFAFTSPGEAVLAWTDQQDDPQYEMSRKALAVLNSETDARGRKIKVHKLPVPQKSVCIEEDDLAGLIAEPGEDVRTIGERLAASYVNFYIANSCVLVPAFGDLHDAEAATLLSRLFPDRNIVQIPARKILVGGGNIHCITQQIPIGQS